MNRRGERPDLPLPSSSSIKWSLEGLTFYRKETIAKFIQGLQNQSPGWWQHVNSTQGFPHFFCLLKTKQNWNIRCQNGAKIKPRATLNLSGIPKWTTGGTKIDPLSLQNDPLSLQNDPLSLQSDPLSLQNDPLSLQNDSLSLQNDPLRLQNDPLSLQNDPLSLQNDPLSLQNDPLRLQNDPLSFQNDPLSLQNDPLRFQNDPLGFQNAPRDSKMALKWIARVAAWTLYTRISTFFVVGGNKTKLMHKRKGWTLPPA